MKKIILILIATIAFIDLRAQDKILELKVDTLSSEIRSIAFDNVVVLDTRIDTSKIGMVQTGMLNKLVVVRYSEPADIAIQKFMQAIIQGAETEPRKLIINLKKLTTFEKTSAINERGYIDLSLAAYLQNTDTGYVKVFSVDSIYEIKSFDVTASLLSSLNNIIESTLYQIALSRNSSENTGNIISAVNIKNGKGAHWSQFPVNISTLYAGGVYKSFDDLKNNKVDSINFSFTPKSKRNLRVYDRNGDNLSDRQVTKSLWGINTGDKIYIRINDVFVPLEKKNNTFFFTFFIPHFPRQSIPEGTNVEMTGMTIRSGIQYMSKQSEFYLDMDNGNIVEYRNIHK